MQESKIAEAWVEISASLKPLMSGLAVAKNALQTFASTAGQIGQRAASAMFQPLMNAASTLAHTLRNAFIGVSATIGDAAALATKSASDLNETVSKIKTVFGSAARTVTN